MEEKNSKLKKGLKITSYIFAALLIYRMLNMPGGDDRPALMTIVQILGIIVGVGMIYCLYVGKYPYLKLLGYISFLFPLSTFIVYMPGNARHEEKMGYLLVEVILECIPIVIILITAYLCAKEAEIIAETFNVEIEKKNCPNCAEEIKLEALVCKYCKSSFTQDEVNKQIHDRQVAFDKENAMADRLRKL